MVHTYISSRPLQTGGVDRLGAVDGPATGPRGEVDVDDEMLTLLRFENGAVGSIEATRNAHGRHNFLTFEIHGERGSITFNYERRDELQVMLADDPQDHRGFRTIYTGPAHPYGQGLWPIPALGIGYGDTKTIELFEFLSAITTGQPATPDFHDGYRICRIADAILESGRTGAWTEIGA